MLDSPATPTPARPNTAGFSGNLGSVKTQDLDIAVPSSQDARLSAHYANPACLQHVVNAVAVLHGRWVPAVLATLYLVKLPCRFSELQRRIPGISEKELARHLAHLTSQGVVQREAVARAVQYSLTADGMRLLGRMKSLGQWSQDRATMAGRLHGRVGAASWVDPILRGTGVVEVTDG